VIRRVAFRQRRRTTRSIHPAPSADTRGRWRALFFTGEPNFGVRVRHRHDWDTRLDGALVLIAGTAWQVSLIGNPVHLVLE
jgi:hypothetical protein